MNAINNFAGDNELLLWAHASRRVVSALHTTAAGERAAE